MVLVTQRSVSDGFVTMTTKDVPVATSLKSSAVAMTEPTVALATEPILTMAVEPAVALVTASTTTAASRGKLYEALKVAIATGVGLVIGAGVVYIYMRSYSNIGKDINAVAQSVNSLKAEVEEMKKNYRLRKRRSLSSGATSRSSDDEGSTPRARRRQVDNRVAEENVDGDAPVLVEEEPNHDAIDAAVASTKSRISREPSERVSRGSSTDGGGEGSSSVYTTASEKRGRRMRSVSRSTNGFESTDDESASVYEEALSVISGGEDEEVSVLTSSTRDEDDFRDLDDADALFDLPTHLLDLIDIVDPLFEGDSTDKGRAYALLEESKSTFDTYPEFLWRFAKASHMLSQIEGAKGEEEKKKNYLFQAFDSAKMGLDSKPADADIQKWYAITLGSIGDYQGLQEKILNGFKFKDHIEYAVTLRPNDPTLHYLLGRWCYSVYMLSWWERRAAAALFAEPPTATIEDALKHFLEADRLKLTAWKGNKLMIAKCYIELNKLEEVRKSLRTAFSLTVVDQDDVEAQREIASLISKYGQSP